MSPLSRAALMGSSMLSARWNGGASLEPASLVLPSSTPAKTLAASWAFELPELKLASSNYDGLLPITVFLTSEKYVTCDWVKKQVELFKQKDDVIDDSFLPYIYLEGPTSYEKNLASCLNEAYRTSTVFSCEDSSETVAVFTDGEIASGPYVAHVAAGIVSLGQVFKVYPDQQQAFMSGVFSTKDGFIPSTVNTISDSTQGIPVPSRIYSMDGPTAQKPFNGYRIGVKDIIDMKGVKTSQGNRAWFHLYDVVNATSPALQKLIDGGAHLVGKTVTAQFANADRPTVDWVDYHDAFNPRGDGYQDPAVSSAGSGAAIASYDWLDVAIATDTGGSIRLPASRNGVYGLRPSFDVLSLDGVLPEGPYFDAIGFHTRSPYTLQSFGKSWLQMNKKYSKYPKKIYVPSDLFTPANNASEPIYDAWIAKVAAFLDAEVIVTNASALWAQDPTLPGHDQPFESYLNEVAFQLEWKYQWDTVIEPFYRDYAAQNDGRTPFVNPRPKSRLDFYKNQTEDVTAEALKRKGEFSDWFLNDVIGTDEDSCSESLWLLPSYIGTPTYRNIYPAPPDVVPSALTFALWYYSVMSGSPEVVLPIGQVPYNSTISNHEEFLPVTIDVLAHRGCDNMLLDLTAALADEGLLKEVKTGSTAF